MITRSENIASISGAFKLLVPRFLVICIIIFGISTQTACNADNRLKIHFLDVGQGDAILISKDGMNILVDGGPSPQLLMNSLSNKLPFWNRTIDMLVLTHAHSDHINGLIEVLQRYEVKHVLYPKITDTDKGYNRQVFNKWLEIIEEKEIDFTLAEAGQYFYINEVSIDIINPPRQGLLTGTHSDIDNNSVVLSIEFGDLSFLLTGDLMWQGELDLVLNRMVELTDVLKVGHHGSLTSSSDEYLNVLRPQLGVICVGTNNYGHPHKDTLQRLFGVMESHHIYRTDTSGEISLVTDGQSLWLKKP